ncbi:MAG TPA: nuclear transport factor 2 family protein [Candidatus Saccharimonadales bacterium]|nr:nuclear transport factor 2 family protein [Candidatus Saccharimonadales bacterium]
MTKAELDAWLTTYGLAWAALDPDAVMKLMSPDGLTYYESTFNEPKKSWDEVNELWQVVRTNQKDVTFWHEIFMADGDAVLAHVKVTRTMVPSGEEQDIDAATMFRINGQGLCTYFRQWRMVR